MAIGRVKNIAGRRPARGNGRARGNKEDITAIAVPALVLPAAVVARVHASAAVVALLAFVLSGCSGLPRPQSEASFSGRRFITTALLHGEPLELHLSAPRAPAAPDVLVLYASGDGGWFGTAVDMFRQAADAGYPAAGFSSRSFLKIQRPRGSLSSPAQLAAEYRQIIAQARTALGLDRTVRTILTGWSRGAAFAVLVGSEPTATGDVLGVVAVGLDEGEDLNVGGPEDETDDGNAPPGKRRWPFETYGRIPRVGPRPCAVIQATHDGYLPAARARELFGPDTALRRLYTVDANNHRFSGGGAAFKAAWLDAIHWMVSPARPPDADGVR